MSYELLILRRAQKELAGLARVDFERIRDSIAALAENPRPPGCKKLVGREGWNILLKVKNIPHSVGGFASHT